MSVLAAIRPDDWNLALFVHILGAMVLVGSLVLVATALAARDLRLGFRSLLIGVLPGWIVMRGAAEWIAEKEKVNDVDPTPEWVDIGYSVADPMLLFIIIATVCAGLAARRQSTGGLRTAALVLVGLMLVASVVAIWAMTTKPT
jgi:uncharacterized membrane protein